MTATGSKTIEAEDQSGRRFRYKTIGEPLGSGSGGVVHLATRLPDEAEDEEAAADDSRRVAIKMTFVPKWKGHLADEAQLLHRLGQQADAIGAKWGGTFRPIRIYSGPKPLRVVNMPVEGGVIELEYLDGVTLRRWFEESWLHGPMSPSEIIDEVLRTGRQLTEALLQVSTDALIHRDIKPDNIMRTSRGLRLFDFNVAKVDRPEPNTTGVGTIGYMAPEVIAGSNYDARADLYSVGVLLWEIAHRRTFDLARYTQTVVGKLTLGSLPSSLADWSEEERAVMTQLLPRLITDVDNRLRKASELLEVITSLEQARRAPEPVADPTTDHDMVSLLSELRPSAMAAVVTDTNGQVPNQALQDFLRERMQVDDPLESWLYEQVVAATKLKTGPILFVLAGNAGDGKSHLLARLMRKRLANQPDVRARIHAIADATHALAATDSQRDRLAKFFAPFADTEPTTDARVHIIAMNTGMVIRFFEGTDEQARFARLYLELQRQLGLRRTDANDRALPWRVEVINLDLRDLLAPGAAGASFAERMLDRLSPGNANGIPAVKWEGCKQCSAFSLCPVAYNLRALEMRTPRKAVLTTLRRAALEADVHLSPRNMWGFLYRLITGGVERYDVANRARTDGPCDVIRRSVASGDGAWLLRGQFTELLFDQEKAGTPWSGIARHDPAFSSAPKIDHLHTRLSIKTELDNSPEIVEQKLGGTGQVLAGLSLDTLTAMLPEAGFKGRRRDAAVRRQVFFHDATFQAWLDHDGSLDFDGLLDAYQSYSKNPTQLTRDQQTHLTQLKDLTKSVFLHGNGKLVRGTPYLRVSQPNARAETMLLVRADGTSLDQVFSLKQILARDVHILAHAQRPELLALLGYRPTQVTLDVLRVRLTVDLALYEFLRRVNDGQKPSVRDLAQFQSLLFIGERVGNELARQQGTKELFVWDDQTNKLFRLGTDDFGTAQLTAVEK
ncbi:MAG: protein kinase [Kofleriaceae bacterium]